MWRYFFHWYEGAVWANILASMMWFIPGYLWGRYHVKKIHGTVQEIHDHLDPANPFTLGNKE